MYQLNWTRACALIIALLIAGLCVKVDAGPGECVTHCMSCAVTGAGSCDPQSCKPGYTLVGGACSPCATGCLFCDMNGAGSCDPGAEKTHGGHNKK